MSNNILSNSNKEAIVLPQHDILADVPISTNADINHATVEGQEKTNHQPIEQRISYTAMGTIVENNLQGVVPFSTGFDDSSTPDTKTISDSSSRKTKRNVVVASITSLLLAIAIGFGFYTSGALEMFARWLSPVIETEFQGPTMFQGPIYIDEVEEVEPDQHYVENINGYTNMIDVNGTLLPYVDSYLTASPPNSGAGLWYGSDSTTDGTWGYFIGHNPGDFNCVLSLVEGDEVIVYDDDGNARRYFVVFTFDVARYSTWGDVKDRVTGYGESVILQTCIDSTSGYRIVVAQ